MNFKLDVSAVTRVFTRLREVVSRPFAAVRGQRQIAAIRRVLTQEATAGAGFGPSGAATRFTPVLAFGSRPATSPPLGGPASLYWQSWLGGAGSVARVTDRGVVVASSLPWAIVHRGGVAVPEDRATVIRAKRISRDGRPAMVHALRLGFGVNISSEKALSGMRVPSRPHADPRAPQYRDAVSGQFDLELREAATS